ncbi:DUF3048 domain-containing protein [Modestobacter marinus]|uniref:DUF3048 domain-containing protein n=1 Tax=Modestobacter marinus TaxID=477641 RepID=UPI0027E1F069|nr:DUF3048 domain-containing protein [Modestobacter marinus]
MARRSTALRAVLLVGVALVGSVACTSSAETSRSAAAAPTTSASPTPTPTPPPPPPPPPPVLWPLTGIESGPVPPRPALAVKIENSVDARPQTGLGAADVVWEEVVEGGITRFVAVYHSTLPPEVGPVRSVRPMDPAIAAPLHGLIAFSGGQAGYVDALAAAGLQTVSFDRGDGGFHRIGARSAPHNVYADPAALLAQADAAHQAPPPVQFDLAAPGEPLPAGTPAAAVRLTLSGLSHPVWTWSEPDRSWLRAEDGRPAVEADGTRLRATNVVVLRVTVVNTSARDAAGTPVPETVLTGSGEALVMTGGSAVPATWSKAGVGDRVVLTGADGAPVRLAPGTTWVELVPLGSGAVAVG